MWGNNPWENDRASDWFANLMHLTHFPDQIRATLLLCEQEDACGENTALPRAAVYCALQVCRVYIWPIEHLDGDLELAIKATHKYYQTKTIATLKRSLPRSKQSLES